MLSDVLRNRWFIGSFIFIIVLAALFCVLTLQDLASFKKRLASTDYVILQETMSQKTQNKVQRDVLETKSPDTMENRPESVEDTSVPAEETTRTTDAVDKNANIDLAVDASTSPYGFGAYPEVPADFPFQEHLWDNDTLVQELLVRVRIKLWKQGIQTTGAGFDPNNGLIYPSISGVLYVKWQNTEDDDPEYPGQRYASLFFGDPDTCKEWESTYLVDRMYEPIDKISDIEELGIKVFEYPDGGLDPYKYLDLPR